MATPGIIARCSNANSGRAIRPTRWRKDRKISHTLLNLRYIRKDAEAMADLLKDPVCGRFAPDHVRLIADEQRFFWILVTAPVRLPRL